MYKGSLKRGRPLIQEILRDLVWIYTYFFSNPPLDLVRNKRVYRMQALHHPNENSVVLSQHKICCFSPMHIQTAWLQVLLPQLANTPVKGQAVVLFTGFSLSLPFSSTLSIWWQDLPWCEPQCGLPGQAATAPLWCCRVERRCAMGWCHSTGQGRGG